ncbi:MAG: pyridoxal phosphate-dependent aminotransferase, partial [Deltaproteobacteria bacterium]|nr:pyridoxal phosphate-dependent aminotransferase [Deltaproteobacteria bacterium]
MLNNPFSHIDSVKPFLAMEISARAHELKNKGKDIIHLEFGEPEFATPKVISDAAIKAIGQKQTKYTHTQGV